jgi:hypothetical protein
VNALNWTSDGYVGIGIANPQRHLHISDVTGATIVLNSVTGAVKNGVYMTESGGSVTTAGAYTYYDGSANVYGIDIGSGTPTRALTIERDTHYVGIGTTTPRSDFVVNGANGMGWINQYGHYVFNNSAESTTNFWTIAGRSSGLLGIGYGSLTDDEYVSGGNDMFSIVSSSGNVGIGTASPQTKLHV